MRGELLSKMLHVIMAPNHPKPQTLNPKPKSPLCKPLPRTPPKSLEAHVSLSGMLSLMPWTLKGLGF